MWQNSKTQKRTKLESLRVAMSVWMFVCLSVCAIGCRIFFRPVIGPEVTWLVPGLSLVLPPGWSFLRQWWGPWTQRLFHGKITLNSQACWEYKLNCTDMTFYYFVIFQYISMLMPAAMPLLGRLVVVGEEGICQDILGVCWVKPVLFTRPGVVGAVLQGRSPQLL